MVSYANRDRKGGCMGVDIENARTHPVTHILGHEPITDIGTINGVNGGTALATHGQGLVAGGEQEFGPLPPGMYEFYIGTTDVGLNVPFNQPIHYRLASSNLDVATTDDPIALSHANHPYYRVKLSSGQTHLNFHNPSITNAAVFLRRLV